MKLKRWKKEQKEMVKNFIFFDGLPPMQLPKMPKKVAISMDRTWFSGLIWKRGKRNKLTIA